MMTSTFAQLFIITAFPHTIISFKPLTTHAGIQSYYFHFSHEKEVQKGYLTLPIILN